MPSKTGIADRRAAEREATQVIERWNERLIAGRATWWSPTIGAALAAGMPWLDVYCAGCTTSRTIDIRKLDRHPLGSIGNLVLGMRCTWCPGGGPMPKITGLYRTPPAAGTPTLIHSAARAVEQLPGVRPHASPRSSRRPRGAEPA
jgi:hypothetical protein